MARYFSISRLATPLHAPLHRLASPRNHCASQPFTTFPCAKPFTASPHGRNCSHRSTFSTRDHLSLSGHWHFTGAPRDALRTKVNVHAQSPRHAHDPKDGHDTTNKAPARQQARNHAVGSQAQGGARTVQKAHLAAGQSVCSGHLFACKISVVSLKDTDIFRRLIDTKLKARGLYRPCRQTH